MSVMSAFRAVSARTEASFSRTSVGSRLRSPMAFTNGCRSRIISARSDSRNSASSDMSAPTSSSGRCQFSELNAYSVSASTPIRRAARVTARTASEPSRWPSTRGSPRASAQRPFPSTTIGDVARHLPRLHARLELSDRGLLGHARLIARVAGRPRARTSVAARV